MAPNRPWQALGSPCQRREGRDGTEEVVGGVCSAMGRAPYRGGVLRVPHTATGVVAGLLGLVSPSLSGMMRCRTYEERMLDGWHATCDSGTRSTSQCNDILDR